MKVIKTLICIILYPFKILSELIDPILRFLEMGIIFPFSFLLGNIVEIINLIPSLGFIHLGEAILGICFGVSFSLLSIYLFHWNINLLLLILISIGVAIAGYFISYIVFKFLINFVTSLVSMIFVAARIALYLPSSIWASFIKMVISFGSWGAIFGIFFSYFTSSYGTIVLSFVILLGIMILISLVLFLIRRDVSFKSLGVFGDVPLEELTVFRNSIGLYFMTFYGMPVYVGRAIEFNNGGLRKRLRDYQRGVNTHSSGVWIQEHIDELNLYVLELGHIENDVSYVKESETTMIENFFTKLNKVDSSSSYVLNILGYLIGGIITVILTLNYCNIPWVTYFICIYASVISIICIVFYCVETANKRR